MFLLNILFILSGIILMILSLPSFMFPQSIISKRSAAAKKVAGAVILFYLGWMSWSADFAAGNVYKRNKHALILADTLADPTLRKELFSSAAIISHLYVQNHLKAPSTANFPFAEKVKVMFDETDRTFFLASYVDAQNPSGIKLHSNYHSKLKYLGNGSWREVETEFMSY